MYKDLKSFQQAEVIYDFTVEFCRRYVDPAPEPSARYGARRSYMSYRLNTSTSYRSDRMIGQMEQAARSGKQNIAEGCSQSKVKPKSEHYLLSIASASLKELLEDYEDFLRQRELTQWGKDDPRAVEVRRLAYRSDRFYTSNKNDRSYTRYKSYMSYMNDPERAANAMICLINQTTYLLDQQIKAVERQMQEKGISRESQQQKVGRILNERKKKEEEFDRYVQGVIDHAKTDRSGVAADTDKME